MKTIGEIKKAIEEFKPTLKTRFKVKEIALFGSYVRSEHNHFSDIDILVDFYEPIGFFAFIDLEERLEKLLGIKVDLVSKNALKPTIGKYILKEMIPV